MNKILLFASAVGLALPVTAQRQRAQNEDPWPMLAKKYDANGDGKITAEEYSRGDRAFANLDRNRDGVVTKDEVGGGGGRGGGRGGGTNRDMSPMVKGMLARAADGDQDGKVSKAEWDGYVPSLDEDQNGVLSGEEILATMGNARRMGRQMVESIIGMLDKDGDEKVQLAEVAGLFAELDADKDGTLAGEEMPAARGGRQGGGREGRQGGGREGRQGRGRKGGGEGRPQPPQAGEDAPDFDLPFVKDSEKSVKLSGFRGSKPVALIFGSYT